MNRYFSSNAFSEMRHDIAKVHKRGAEIAFTRVALFKQLLLFF